MPLRGKRPADDPAAGRVKIVGKTIAEGPVMSNGKRKVDAGESLGLPFFYE
jgi:hypothetical protein